MFRLATSLVVILVTVAAQAQLSCNFVDECCWKGDEDWRVQDGHDISINEFRRTFLVGRSRPPPAGKYLVHVDEGDGEESVYQSCSFCSSDGLVSVQYRHWQSPTSRLRLCWSLANDTSKIFDCNQASAGKQSQIVAEDFNVLPNQPIVLQFIAENLDGGARAVIMIDRIRISNNECHTATHLIQSTGKTNSMTAVQPASLINEEVDLDRVTNLRKKVTIQELSYQDDRVKNKLQQLTKSSSKFRQPPPRKTTKLDVPVAKAAATSIPADLKPSNIPPPPAVTSGKDFNPLNDLLGEDLANFLDPNYVSNDEDEIEEPDYADGEAPQRPQGKPLPALKIRKVDPIQVPNFKPPVASVVQPSGLNRKAIVIPKKPLVVERKPFLSELQRPLPLGIPGPCQTTGGCLFENGYCNWRTPAQIPVSSAFRRSHVGLSNFVQATVPSGEISALESDTVMSESHTMIFDVLEWQSGVRMVGCCYVNDKLHCPFGTPNDASAQIWEIGKFECPAGTEKIVFICENYGSQEAVCGLDNVRLHRSNDIFFLEPCQKDQLSQL